MNWAYFQAMDINLNRLVTINPPHRIHNGTTYTDPSTMSFSSHIRNGNGIRNAFYLSDPIVSAQRRAFYFRYILCFPFPFRFDALSPLPVPDIM